MSGPVDPSRSLDALRDLIRSCADNPFQSARLRAAGIDASVASVADFCAAMPLTTKDELVADQQAHPPYGSNLSHAFGDYVRIHQTSSTSGRQPLRWLDTAASWDALLQHWQTIFAAAGMTSADRVFVPFSFGPFIGLWMAFDAAVHMGCLTIPGGAMNSVLRLNVMQENQVTTMCCTPTYAIRLGEVAREQNINVEGLALRTIIVAGEPGGSLPATRARIESLWPTAQVFDHYGMTEVGPVTYQCTAQTDHVHVLDDAFIVEVIDRETGEAADTGELVLTTLARRGSPLLRYRTGDLVKRVAAVPCACGRHTVQFAGGVLGRADDMVFVRGVNVYPSAVEQLVRSIDGIAEYRVEIRSDAALTELRMQIEPDASSAPTEVCRAVEEAFRNRFSLRVPVDAVASGTLPRPELKSKRWIRIS